MTQITYRHVDVFSHKPLSGNGLTVFLNSALNYDTMKKITQEMRQYESIFLEATSQPHRFKARIFTMEEELDFAGHPILGAACVVHEGSKNASQKMEWIFELAQKSVAVTTVKKTSSYFATMEQGSPLFLPPVDAAFLPDLAAALNLSSADLDQSLPLQVVSTGLPYLIIPVRCSLAKVKIIVPHFAELLAQIEAKFAYIIHVSDYEGRTWDNEGKSEDVATGSAAGPVGAYFVKHGIKRPNEEIIIHQGRFLNRPSQIAVHVAGTPEQISSVKVSGEVCMVATGLFDRIIL